MGRLALSHIESGFMPKSSKKTDADRPSENQGKDPAFLPRASRAERIARGEALRETCPRGSHGTWSPPDKRPDPVALLQKSNKGRLPELIPVRHARMLPTPFTFFRGTALNMAVDLAATPATGIRVQACGDAHLGNFRCFATPERRVIFDIHDLDETLPAPWEWDLKRLTSSFVLASRTANHSEKKAREAVLTCVRSYRERMAEFSEMRTIEVWYSSFEADQLFEEIQDEEIRDRKEKRLTKARGICAVDDDFPKLTEEKDGLPKLKDCPNVLYHTLNRDNQDFFETVGKAFSLYRESLPEDRRVLLDRYQVADMAVRVVGVGSVGTYCSLALLMAGEKDPLFLQVKEARPSVLEAFAGNSLYANHGQRVVMGHRLMQSASDIFLGWTSGKENRNFYVRQLRDVKVKFDVEKFNPSEMEHFADWCGGTLARAHARSGDPALITGYLGKGDKFEEAIADFSVAYADQCEQDHEAMKKAVKAGKLEVCEEESVA